MLIIGGPTGFLSKHARLKDKRFSLPLVYPNDESFKLFYGGQWKLFLSTNSRLAGS